MKTPWTPDELRLLNAMNALNAAADKFDELGMESWNTKGFVGLHGLAVRLIEIWHQANSSLESMHRETERLASIEDGSKNS